MSSSGGRRDEQARTEKAEEHPYNGKKKEHEKHEKHNDSKEHDADDTEDEEEDDGEPTVLGELNALAGAVVHAGVEKVAKRIGVDTKSAVPVPQQLSELSGAAVDVLRSEEGKKTMANISTALEEGAEQLREPLNKIADIGNELVEKEKDKAKVLARDLATDVMGPVVSVPLTIIDAAQAVGHGVSAANKVAGVADEHSGGIMSAAHKLAGEAQQFTAQLLRRAAEKFKRKRKSAQSGGTRRARRRARALRHSRHATRMYE